MAFNKNDAHETVEEGRKTANEASGKAHHFIDKAEKKAKNMYDEVCEGANRVAGDVYHKAEDVYKKGENLVNDLAHYVEKNPLKSVAYAAITGIVIDRIFKIFK